MKDVINIASYLNKRYSREQDAKETATHALSKLLEGKFGLTIDDLPETPEMYDALVEAEELIQEQNFDAAASVLTDYVNECDTLI